LSQTITSEALIKELKSLGFVEIAKKGGHLILEHPGYKQRIALPIASPNKELTLNIIITIAKVLIEAGIVSKGDLEGRILKTL